MKKDEKHKTVFRTCYDHYEYLTMSLSLINDLAIFQIMMNEILRDLLNQRVIVYIDDILLYSKNETKHETLVKRLLQRLQNHELVKQLDKCVFHVQEVNFLSYTLFSEDVALTDETIRMIQD